MLGKKQQKNKNLKQKVPHQNSSSALKFSTFEHPSIHHALLAKLTSWL